MDLLVSLADGQWQARFGPDCWPCAIGRGGLRHDKCEGDGATPTGCWPVRRILYRADRLSLPPTALPHDPLGRGDGWCDDPKDPRYNTQTTRPYAGHHERLWRRDGIYDCIVVLGYNDDPPLPGAGSAIFVHLARPGYPATEGCVALARDHLMAFVRGAGRTSRVCMTAP